MFRISYFSTILILMQWIVSISVEIPVKPTRFLMPCAFNKEL